MKAILLLLLVGMSFHLAQAATGLNPLSSADVQANDDDLRPFAEVTDSARMIALGETVHTSRGYYQMKHRLIRYLVSSRNVRLVLMETPMMGAFTATAFVDSCKGTADAAAESVFKVFQDVATRDLLQDLCDFNRSHPNDKVQFYGYDIQERSSLDYLLGLLGQLHASTTQSLAATLKECLVMTPLAAGGSLPPNVELEASHQHCLSGLQQAGEILKPDLDQLPPWQRFLTERSLASARMFEFELFFEGKKDIVSSSIYRDQGMADNVIAFDRYFGNKLRIANWAHNYHIATEAYNMLAPETPGWVKSMGTWLKENYGKDYQAIRLTAYHVKINWFWTQVNYPEYPVVADSIEGKIHDSGMKFAFLDLAGDWLAPDTTYFFRDGEKTIPAKSYRAIVYLEESLGNIYIH